MQEKRNEVRYSIFLEFEHPNFSGKSFRLGFTVLLKPFKRGSSCLWTMLDSKVLQFQIISFSFRLVSVTEYRPRTSIIDRKYPIIALVSEPNIWEEIHWYHTIFYIGLKLWQPVHDVHIPLAWKNLFLGTHTLMPQRLK